jgi:hypothetical protein
MKQNTKANSVSHIGITWPSKGADVIQSIVFVSGIHWLLIIDL